MKADRGEPWSAVNLQHSTLRDITVILGTSDMSKVSSRKSPPKRMRIDFLASPRDVLCYFGYSADIGRSHECVFSLLRAPKAVSGRHAIFYFEPIGNVFYIRDEGSRNGTFVNGKRISVRQSVQLDDSDIVDLSTELSFRFNICDRFDGSGAVPTGALVSRYPETEIARYLLVPSGRFSVGMLPKCAIPVENAGAVRTLGWICRDVNYLQFENEIGDRIELEQGTEINFGFSRVVMDLKNFSAEAFSKSAR